MTDKEIKKSMYLEFENKDNIYSIKDELFESMKNLKQDNLINSSTFHLEDTMSAFVINHQKMDPHFHNEKIIYLKKKFPYFIFHLYINVIYLIRFHFYPRKILMI